MKKALIDFIKQQKNDEYYTPEYAIKPLLKYLPRNITVWECTDYGESNITSILRGGGTMLLVPKKKILIF